MCLNSGQCPTYTTILYTETKGDPCYKKITILLANDLRTAKHAFQN